MAYSCMMFYFLQQNEGTIVCISNECNKAKLKSCTVNLDFPTLTYFCEVIYEIFHTLNCGFLLTLVTYFPGRQVP